MDTKDVENLSSDESSQSGDKRKAKDTTGGDKRKAKEPTEKQTEGKKSKTTGGSKKTGVSEVWQHFGKKFVDEDGETRAKCNYCDKALACHSRKDGTTSLKRHLKSCTKHPSKLKDQCNLFVKKNEDGTGEASIKNWKFSAEKGRKAIARMIIVDELPFATVEKEGFRNLIETVCPNLKIPSRFTVAKDCGDLYLEEKAKLKSYFTNSKTKVSLTTDTWTSIQRINYMCVTAHFVDQDWVYHKRIISFKAIYSHKGEEIARALVQCLREWDIEYVLAITLDNASSNDSAITILKDKLPNQMLGGKYLHVRCMAHIINLIVKDGLTEKVASVDRIRDAVRYVRQSSKRLDAFKECAKKANVESKAMVCLDVSTRWNSTYDMLATAEKYENAFAEYDLEDSNFSRELDRVPRTSDWMNARMLANILGLFKQKTTKASASTKAVVNEFFYETMDIDKHLRTLEESYDLVIRTMGGRMRLKFEKYWRDEEKFNNLLYFGSILDPRLKVRIIAFGYTRIITADQKYVDPQPNETEKDKADRIKRMVQAVTDPIIEDLKMLFEIYRSAHESTKAYANVSQKERHVETSSQVECDFFSEFKSDGGFTTYNTKSELEIYLDDKEEAGYEGFDILQWWKGASSKYPILSQMAKDILAVPVSSVASESAFSTGGRVVDTFRSSLSPAVVEALVCTQDWIRKSAKPINGGEDFTTFDELGKEISEKLEAGQINTERDYI